MTIKKIKWPSSCLRIDGIAQLGVVALLCMLPSVAQASHLSPELVDKVADIIAIFVLIIAPLTFIGLFWLVHIVPEKHAHEIEHPQKEAIKYVCLSSLFFGGLLWPIAWIWSHTKPVAYMLAYGRDKHDDYYLKHHEELKAPAEVEATAPAQNEPPHTESASAMAMQIRMLQRRIDELESRLKDSP